MSRFRAIDINNGGLSVFSFNKQGEAMLQSLNMTAHMYSDHIFHYWVLFLVKSSLLPDLDEPDGKSVYTVVWEEQYILFFAPPLAWAKISLLYLVIIKTIWSAYAKEQIIYIYIYFPPVCHDWYLCFKCKETEKKK